MKQDRDWMDVMRSTLRDAETPPPADGWARLERELRLAAAPRVPAWRIHWPRIAAAAAAVMICIAAGEFLWRADQDLTGIDGDVITEAVSGGSAADQVLLGLTGDDAIPSPAVADPASEVVANTRAQQINTPAPRSVQTAAVRRSRATSAAYSGAKAADLEPSAATQDEAQAATEAQSPKAATNSKSAMQDSGKSARRAVGESSRATLYDGDFVAYTPPRKKTSFSLYGGGGVTGGNTTSVAPRMHYESPSLGTGQGSSISLMKQYDYARGSFRHHQPLSFGLSVRKEFAYGLSLESGVNYTLLHSEVSLFLGSKEIDQKLHFIGIPLRLNWQFLERGRFSLYIGAGGMVEKCVSARYDGKTAEEPKIQWSVLGAAGAQYKLGGTVALYFEPEVSYYFTETELRSVRTDSPLTLTLRMGVRLSF